MPDELVSVIDRMYQDFELTFSVGEATSSIPYIIGVHQGDNLAPILFNLFFQAAVESLAATWESDHSITTPKFRWFPKDKGRLRKQGKAKGVEFEFWKSLYVDDGAFLFENRRDLEKGANATYLHFKRLGLTMHTGSDGSFKDSKTEAVYFEAPGEDHSEANTSPVPVQNGYITYTDTFTYLGSKVTHNLDDRIDVEARKKQATKALGAMMKNVFNNPHLEVKNKRMLYLAILVNLLLWGSETWALLRKLIGEAFRFFTLKQSEKS